MKQAKSACVHSISQRDFTTQPRWGIFRNTLHFYLHQPYNNNTRFVGNDKNCILERTCRRNCISRLRNIAPGRRMPDFEVMKCNFINNCVPKCNFGTSRARQIQFCFILYRTSWLRDYYKIIIIHLPNTRRIGCDCSIFKRTRQRRKVHVYRQTLFITGDTETFGNAELRRFLNTDIEETLISWMSNKIKQKMRMKNESDAKFDIVQ